MMTPVSSSIQVPPHCHNQRIDTVLAQLFPDYSRSQLAHWIKAGLITLNGHRPKPKDKVAALSVIGFPDPWPDDSSHPTQALPEEIPLSIVYEDTSLLLVNKPAGLVVHPGAGNHTHTLVNALLHHAPELQELPRAGIVHRLDKDTTGLLVVAKTLPAYTHLTRQMQAREIKRDYWALVQGHVISGGTIHTHYGRHPHNRLKMAVCTGGREAITHYRVNKHYQGYFTALDLSLETGRTHQIRVHMAHLNHPILGDVLYGKRPKTPPDLAQETLDALLSLGRQALHARQLTLTHPQTKEAMTFTAELPADLQFLLTNLDHYFAEHQC